MYVSYSDMPYMLTHGKPFQGNSVTAIRIDNQFEDGHKYNEYVVYSYNTIIYTERRYHNGKIVRSLNNVYYSSTTSKLQNMLIRAMCLQIPCKRSQGWYIE